MKGFFDDTEEQDFIEQTYSKPKRRPRVFGEARSLPTNIRADQETGNLVTTPCECKMNPNSDGFFCDRHKCLKSKSLHTLCQTRQDYFNLWEDGRGPLQDSYTKVMKKQETKAREHIMTKRS